MVYLDPKTKPPKLTFNPPLTLLLLLNAVLAILLICMNSRRHYLLLYTSSARFLGRVALFCHGFMVDDVVADSAAVFGKD